jgi:hypothetical protein
MAQRVQVILVCDLHDAETPGTETVTFALDGTGYEIDVCDQHGRELRGSFAPYVGAARRGSGRGSGRAAGAGARRRSRRGGSGDAARIREWARTQGLPVPERGRIPADLAERYAVAHRG